MAADVFVKFQSHRTILNVNLAATRPRHLTIRLLIGYQNSALALKHFCTMQLTRISLCRQLTSQTNYSTSGVLWFVCRWRIYSRETIFFVWQFVHFGNALNINGHMVKPCHENNKMNPNIIICVIATGFKLCVRLIYDQHLYHTVVLFNTTL